METQIISANYLPSYIAYPRFLIEFNISETSKLIYSLLLDRARISLYNEKFKDDFGRVFVLFTTEDLAKITGKSIINIKRCLKALEENKLIEKENQGLYRPCKIFVKIPKSAENNTCTSIENDTHTSIKNEPHEYQKRYPNNKYNNINNKNKENIYGPCKNVLLSDDDFNELKNSVPNYEEYIDRLSYYMKMKGKTYNDHLATIKNWADKDKPTIKTSYDLSDF